MWAVVVRWGYLSPSDQGYAASGLFYSGKPSFREDLFYSVLQCSWTTAIRREYVSVLFHRSLRLPSRSTRSRESAPGIMRRSSRSVRSKNRVWSRSGFHTPTVMQ